MKLTPFRIFLIVNYGFVFGFWFTYFPYSIDESRVINRSGALEHYKMCGVKIGCTSGLRINNQRIACRAALFAGDYTCPELVGVSQGEVHWYKQRTLINGEVVQALRIKSNGRERLNLTLAEIQRQILFDMLSFFALFSILPVGIYGSGRKRGSNGQGSS